MKKFYLSLLFIFSAVLTYAAPDMYAHIDGFEIFEKPFFEKIINGDKATYTVCVEETDNSKSILYKDWGEKIFLTALNNWKQKTKHYISKNKEKLKFADILEIANRENNIEQVPCNIKEDESIETEADLILFITKSFLKSCGGPYPCFNPRKSIIYMGRDKRIQDKKYIQLMTHEMGHAFGLGDQYSGSTYRSSFIYSSKVLRPAIMGRNKTITCDDIDGLITVIDRIKGIEREFHSLCKDGIFIKNGQGVIKPFEKYSFKENYDYFDAEIEVSYDDSLNELYILDITMKNFILSEEGLYLLEDMGFKVYDYSTLKNVQVKIHGSILERIVTIEDLTYAKLPIGLWTSVLYIKKFNRSIPKQVVTQDFLEEQIENPLFIDIDSNTSESISRNLVIPLITSLHKQGVGRKEKIRKEFPFRFLKRNKKEKSNLDTSAATKGAIDKNITKEINEHLKNIFPPDSK